MRATYAEKSPSIKAPITPSRAASTSHTAPRTAAAAAPSSAGGSGRGGAACPACCACSACCARWAPWARERNMQAPSPATRSSASCCPPSGAPAGPAPPPAAAASQRALCSSSGAAARRASCCQGAGGMALAPGGPPAGARQQRGEWGLPLLPTSSLGFRVARPGGAPPLTRCSGSQRWVQGAKVHALLSCAPRQEAWPQGLPDGGSAEVSHGHVRTDQGGGRREVV